MWKSRIAPTPSGFLHIGNAFNFLLTSELTEQHSGTLRLRIDDLDMPRVRAEYLQNIFDMLAWLGIKWQAGPVNMPEQETAYSQLLRLDRYNGLIDQLIQTGKVYACTCPRNVKHIEDPCRSKYLPYNTTDAALKIMADAMPIAIQDHIAGQQIINLQDSMGDFVIRRKDGRPAYQLTSLADDTDFEITHIVRGIDLIHSTAAQLYLATLLGGQQFLNTSFYHHPLIADTTGAKLSKSAGNGPLITLQEQYADAHKVKEQYQAWRKSYHVE